MSANRSGNLEKLEGGALDWRGTRSFAVLARHGAMVNVCMISDFFYPSMGGVENHVYQLAQCLLMQGHKVVVVTHRYGQRCGVRWLPRGLKVYYLPFCGVHDRVVLPTGLMLLPLLRDVLIRERITMVHVHAHVENNAGMAGPPEYICQWPRLAKAGGRPGLYPALAGHAGGRIGRSLWAAVSHPGARRVHHGAGGCHTVLPHGLPCRVHRALQLRDELAD